MDNKDSLSRWIRVQIVRSSKITEITPIKRRTRFMLTNSRTSGENQYVHCSVDLLHSSIFLIIISGIAMGCVASEDFRDAGTYKFRKALVMLRSTSYLGPSRCWDLGISENPRDAGAHEFLRTHMMLRFTSFWKRSWCWSSWAPEGSRNSGSLNFLSLIRNNVETYTGTMTCLVGNSFHVEKCNFTELHVTVNPAQIILMYFIILMKLHVSLLVF